MKAAVLRELKHPLVIEDVAVPELGADDVLVETRSCGICRTDLHIQDGLAYVPKLPHIPGHEPAGIVSAVGARVKDIQIGQRVVPHLFFTCGHCACCRTGRDAQCMHVDGVLGVTRPGAFAEYFAAPARNLLPLPEEVGFEAGGLASCAGVTAVHAYRRARLGVNDTAVVLGAGGIGLILTQILKAAGARVVVVSRSEQSLMMAAEYDADLMLLSETPDVVEQIEAFTGGAGARMRVRVRRYRRHNAPGPPCLPLAADKSSSWGKSPNSRPSKPFRSRAELKIIGSRSAVPRQDAADAPGHDGRRHHSSADRSPSALDEINEAPTLLRGGQAPGRNGVTIP